MVKSKKKLLILSLVIILALVYVYNLRKSSNFFGWRKAEMARRIVNNLEQIYGEEFYCDSLGTYGGLATYICHPISDPSLHFKGEASTGGTVTASAYPDALLAREDTLIMNDILSQIPGTVVCFRNPYHSWYLDRYNVYGGEYSIEELRKTIYHRSIFFDIFFNISDEDFINDPELEYYYLQQCAEEMLDIYRNASDYRCCLLMHVYYMDDDNCSYALGFLGTGYDESNDPEFRFGKEIVLAFGSEEELDPDDSWRMDLDEFKEERYYMDLYIKDRYGFK